jgi:putative SOS response-associated peptidase YedK
MCGRYTRNYSWREVHDFLDLQWPSVEGPALALPERSYNIAPTQAAPICVASDAHRALIAARWGFRPAWASKGGTLAPINARSETAPTSSLFREAFARHRCLVPASGFYEWRKRDREALGPPAPRTTSRPGVRQGPKEPPKQPELFTVRDTPIFCFAGLWTPAPQGEANADGLATFTILTCPPNDLLAKIHDRMPVILRREDFSAWLSADGDTAIALLRPFDPRAMASHAVSTRVNSPKNNHPDLLREVDAPPSMPGLFG